MEEPAIPVQPNRSVSPIPDSQAYGQIVLADRGIDQGGANPMSARAGINPNPLDLVRLCGVLHDHYSNGRIEQFCDVHSRVRIGSRRVLDFAHISLGQVRACERLAQLACLLTFGLYQVRVHEMTHCDAVRASEIREPNAGRVQLVIHAIESRETQLRRP